MNKGIIRLISICLISGMLSSSIPVLASESRSISENEIMEKNEIASEIKASFADMASEEILMALVYSQDTVPVYSDDSISSVKTYLESGHTVYIEDICFAKKDSYVKGEYQSVSDNITAYYKVTYFEDGVQYEGYISREQLAYSNEAWINWEKENLSFLEKVTDSQGISDNSVEETLCGDTFLEDYSDIESFPADYQAKLMALKDKHPNWVFVPVNTKLDFNTAVSKEMGDKSWIYYTDSNKNNGYLGEATSQKNWYYATKKAVEHYLDPRTYLDETRIFAFEQLTYNSSYHTEEAVQKFLNGTFMSGEIPGEGKSYANAFYSIGKSRKLSPTHLASRVYQEQGKGTSPLISGTYSGYEGYYNYFNVGATGSTTTDVIVNGLKYAKSKGWNSRYKSLEGGAATIGNNYVLKGQDTSYLQKFNVAPGAANATYTHQYMQNIQAPYTESSSTYKMYSGAGSLKGAFVFKVPVFNNMPGSSDTPAEPVIIKLNSFSITNKSEIQNMLTGQTATVSFEFSPKNTTDSTDVEWKTSNSKVVSVDNGKLTAVGKGSCTISAAIGPNKITDSVVITVSNCKVTFLKADGKTTAKSLEVPFGYSLVKSDFPDESVLSQSDSEMELEGFFENVVSEDNGSSLSKLYTEGTVVRQQNMVLIPHYVKRGLGFYVSSVGAFTYTGSAIKPEINVYDSTKYTGEDGSLTLSHVKLEYGKDYTISYSNNKNVGSRNNENISKRPTITVKGKGNYSGSQKVYFDIIPKSLNDEDIKVDEMCYAYTGKEIRKVPTIYAAGRKLKNNTDYTVSYPLSGAGSYINAGTWPVTITGKNGYEGTITVLQTISKRTLISKAKLTTIPNQKYDSQIIDVSKNKGIEPEIKLSFEGEDLINNATTSDGKSGDYSVRFEDNMSVGTARAIITATPGGEFAGSRVVTFKITGNLIKNAVIKSRTTLLNQGAISDKTYGIIDKDKMLQDNYLLYYGDSQLTQSTDNGVTGDYTVSYTKSDKAGTATICFTGINGYTGTLKKSYRITPVKLSEEASSDGVFSCTLNEEYSYVKGGVKVLPEVKFIGAESGQTVILEEGKDYKLSYSKNNAVNDASDEKNLPTVIIKGTGNYSGTITKSFKIKKRDLAEFVAKDSASDDGTKATIYAPDLVYSVKKNGFKSSPVLTDSSGKKLSAGTDYSKQYVYRFVSDTDLDGDGITDRIAGTEIDENDILPAGTKVNVTVNGLADGKNYNDAATSFVYRITQLSIADRKVKATIDPQEYTGRQIKPKDGDIKIQIGDNPLIIGRDYDILSYGENIQKGKGYVIIRGIGDYGATRKITFSIKTRGILWWVSE